MVHESACAVRSAEDHLALIHEVSALVTTETSSELVFAEVVERIYEFFDFDAVVVYAGDPLTLRLQFGGVPTGVGTLVPEGLPQLALHEVRPMTTADPAVRRAFPRVPWASEDTISEVALPLLFHGQRVGVLSLFCSSEGGLDASTLSTLSTLAHLLVVSAIQERWVRDDRISRKLHRAYQRLQEFADFKDQILQNISHELRTPLTLIKGYLELLHTGQMGAILDEQSQALRIVVNKVDDIVAIVDRTVALSPLGSLSLDYHRVPVAALLDEVMPLFSARARTAGITLHLQTVDPDLCLYGDREQIRQVCYNIVDNSLKFSPSGGQVTVVATSEDEYVHLMFHDEGIGIPKQQLNQIFDTFYQIDGSTTRRFGGLGLGLAVVSRVVRAHNGKVWAESEVDCGSIFHVLLPKHGSGPHLLGSE